LVSIQVRESNKANEQTFVPFAIFCKYRSLRLCRAAALPVQPPSGFKMYGGDWPAPFNREDWLYTPSVTATYAVNKQVAIDVSYLYDSAASKVPNTKGREYTRHLASLGIKYTF
jgi:hypothetical protein